MAYEACAVLRIICNNGSCRRAVLAWQPHDAAAAVGPLRTPSGQCGVCVVVVVCVCVCVCVRERERELECVSACARVRA